MYQLTIEDKLKLKTLKTSVLNAKRNPESTPFDFYKIHEASREFCQTLENNGYASISEINKRVCIDSAYKDFMSERHLAPDVALSVWAIEALFSEQG